jgi:hypothetical protein
LPTGVTHFENKNAVKSRLSVDGLAKITEAAQDRGALKEDLLLFRQ